MSTGSPWLTRWWRDRKSPDAVPRMALHRGRRCGDGRRMGAGPAPLGAEPAGALQSSAPATPRRSRFSRRPGWGRDGAIAARLFGLGTPAGAPPARWRAGWKPICDETAAMSGASSWSFREDDSQRIQAILRGFLGESNARTAL